MVKSFAVGNRVVGSLVDNKGLIGSVIEILVTDNKLKYKVRWENGRETIVTNRGIKKPLDHTVGRVNQRERPPNFNPATQEADDDEFHLSSDSSSEESVADNEEEK